MIDVFRETRERVSAQDAARRYGLTFDRKGWAVCPFHRDKHPSMSFRAGRFRCWACNAAGDSVDFTGRLLGLEPLAAVERLNADFSLGLPLHRQPTPEDLQAARRRREIAQAHKAFDAWRADMTQRLNACLRLAGRAKSHGEEGGVSLLELKQRLDALTAEQAVLLDKILEDMGNKELNAQLEAVTAEKQDILDRMQALEKDESQQAIRASRQWEMEEWLDRQEMRFTEYEDTVTRRFVERITVMDADTIRVKIKDVDVVIDRKL